MRWGIISGNIVLLLGVGSFVIINRSASQTIRSGTVNSFVTTTESLRSPLDVVSSAQIALQVAQMTNLPELTSVRNQTDSENSQLAAAPSDTNIVAKPQIITTALKSKNDILRYTTLDGDSISSVAVKFGLSANSIRWSNNLTGDAVAPGKVLLIPPGNGLVYQIKTGDSIDSIVNTYKADKATFISVNDAESGQLVLGDNVWVPGGVVAAPVLYFSPGIVSGAHRFGSCGLKVPGVTGAYDCGWCTWWTAYRRMQVGHPVPTGLGDARSWRNGMSYSSQARPGAVIWFGYGGNHVGFVEKVNTDGSVEISEMNQQGWDVVSNRTIPAGQAGSYSYLY